jgi:hypothetical protein
VGHWKTGHQHHPHGTFPRRKFLLATFLVSAYLCSCCHAEAVGAACANVVSRYENWTKKQLKRAA